MSTKIPLDPPFSKGETNIKDQNGNRDFTMLLRRIKLLSKPAYEIKGG
jgi:hypothetical protein